MCEYERISQKDGERKENKMKKKKETRLAESGNGAIIKMTSA